MDIFEFAELCGLDEEDMALLEDLYEEEELAFMNEEDEEEW